MVVEALQNLGIVAIGAGGAGLVARYGIDRCTEVVELSIDRLFDEEMARYRSELEDDRVVFTRLHEERASVVVELYQRFVRFRRDVRALTTAGPSDRSSEELLERARTSGDEFAEFYSANRIYFPSETCDDVDRLLDEMADLFAASRAGGPHGSRADQRPDAETWRASWRAVSDDEVPELEHTLERHCRDLLGVEVD